MKNNLLPAIYQPMKCCEKAMFHEIVCKECTEFMDMCEKQFDDELIPDEMGKEYSKEPKHIELTDDQFNALTQTMLNKHNGLAHIQHTSTPKYKITKLRKSVDIWSSNGNEFFCLVPCELGSEEAAIKKAEFVLNILNNHDRLVEVLEMFIDATGVMDVKKVSNYLRTAHLIGSNLLTELKS